jgi:hypothetical protein
VILKWRKISQGVKCGFFPLAAQIAAARRRCGLDDGCGWVRHETEWLSSVNASVTTTGPLGNVHWYCSSGDILRQRLGGSERANERALPRCEHCRTRLTFGTCVEAGPHANWPRRHVDDADTGQ